MVSAAPRVRLHHCHWLSEAASPRPSPRRAYRTIAAAASLIQAVAGDGIRAIGQLVSNKSRSRKRHRNSSLTRLVLMWVQPDFRAEFGGIVNIESLIELFGMIRDRGELEAEFVRNLRPRLAKDKVNSDSCLRRRRAAFTQHAGGIGDRVLAQFDRHR